MTTRKDMASSSGHLETGTKAISKTTRGTGRERCLGPTAATMKETGSKGSSTVTDACTLVTELLKKATLTTTFMLGQ